jgi:hypothetical protein
MVVRSVVGWESLLAKIRGVRDLRAIGRAGFARDGSAYARFGAHIFAVCALPARRASENEVRSGTSPAQRGARAHGPGAPLSAPGTTVRVRVHDRPPGACSRDTLPSPRSLLPLVQRAASTAATVGVFNPVDTVRPASWDGKRALSARRRRASASSRARSAIGARRSRRRASAAAKH